VNENPKTDRDRDEKLNKIKSILGMQADQKKNKLE
jgi:hypothetical protein